MASSLTDALFKNVERTISRSHDASSHEKEFVVCASLTSRDVGESSSPRGKSPMVELVSPERINDVEGKSLSFKGGDIPPRPRSREKARATISESHGSRYGKGKCPQASMDMGDDGDGVKTGEEQGRRRMFLPLTIIHVHNSNLFLPANQKSPPDCRRDLSEPG